MAGGNPLTRRTLCIGVGATVAMAGLGALRYVGSEPLVRPPGGQDEENLVSRCMHCYRCIEACPEKVIVAASLGCGRAEYAHAAHGVLRLLPWSAGRFPLL